MSPFLIPNFHVALIHFPIALLMAGVAAEVVCRLAFRQSGARVAARWMILLAAVSGWPAFYSGLYAVRHIAGADFEGATWLDIRANSPALSNQGIFETLQEHFLLNALAIVLTNVVVIGWLMLGEVGRRRLYGPALAMLLLGVAATVFAAWHGGELVYWHDATNIAESAGRDTAGERTIDRSLAAFAPPLDTHVLLAGVTTGLCLLTWAVASRSRRVLEPADPASLPSSEMPPSSKPQPYSDPQSGRIFAAFQPSLHEAAAEPPGMTLGWITAVAVLATSLFGMWSLASSYETWSPRVLLDAIVDPENADSGLSRRLAHFLAGVALLVLPVLVAWLGTRCRSSRTVPLIIGAVLLAAVLFQTWLGVLLLLDSNMGLLFKINA